MTANDLMSLIHEYGRVENQLGQYRGREYLTDYRALEEKSGELRDTIWIELDKLEREKK